MSKQVVALCCTGDLRHDFLRVTAFRHRVFVQNLVVAPVAVVLAASGLGGAIAILAIAPPFAVRAKTAATAFPAAALLLAVNAAFHGHLGKHSLQCTPKREGRGGGGRGGGGGGGGGGGVSTRDP